MAGQKDFDAFVAEILASRGGPAAEKFQVLFSLARSKQPCDVRTSAGTLHLHVRIGADFVYGFEFEAERDDLVARLDEIKLVKDGLFIPVETVSIDDISAVVRLPKKKITRKDMNAVRVDELSEQRLPSGQLLSEFIQDVYSPVTPSEADHYLRRYLVAQASRKNG